MSSSVAVGALVGDGAANAKPEIVQPVAEAGTQLRESGTGPAGKRLLARMNVRRRSSEDAVRGVGGDGIIDDLCVDLPHHLLDITRPQIPDRQERGD